MGNISGTFYKPELVPGRDLRRNRALIYWTLVKNQTLCFFWKQEKRHSVVFIVNFQHIQDINTLFNIDMCHNYRD